jgi:glycosyltransferase involved in cell wall biosynthesis
MISVLVAVQNGAKTLQRCIDSITSQSYASKELIIIDGGSTDGTLDVLRDNDEKIAYWESEPDRGISHAWNKGLRHTNGDWVLFLGADDVLYDQDTLCDFMKKQKQIGLPKKLLYGQVAMTQSGNIKEIVGEPWPRIESIVMAAENKIPHQGLFHARELFSAYSDFDETLGITGDYEFILRCIRQGVTPHFIDDFIVTKMQKGGVSNAYSSTIFTYVEFAKSRKRNKFKVYSVQYLWLFSKGIIKYLIGWVGKMIRRG